MIQNFATPILLLIFNRPETTQKVFDQIRAVKPLYLYVAADGPRPEREDDTINCQKARDIIKQVDWTCEVKTLFRDENLGCGFAVCSAITWFFEQVQEGIILEDDCLPDISFFPFCTELLSRYKSNENIYVISGINRQNGLNHGNGSYFFSHYPMTWGWATWRRAWDQFRYDIPHWDQSFKSGDLDHVFQSYQEKIYWKKKIKLVESEKKNIWDYQWCYAMWKNKGIGITPNINMIINLGVTNPATHTFLNDSIRAPLTSGNIQFPLKHPEIKVDRDADRVTFKTALSHSPTRLLRLIKENGILTIVKYVLSKRT